MHVYIFYIISNCHHRFDSKYTDDIDKYFAIRADSVEKIGDTFYAIYAFTEKKKYAKEFMEIRDMNLFYKKEVEMSQIEYVMFCEEHSDYLLTKQKFCTKVIENGIVRSKYVSVLCTGMEYDESSLMKESNILDQYEDLTEFLEMNDFKLTDFPFFKDDILKALDVLALKTLIMQLYSMDEYEMFFNKNIGDTIEFDEIALFIKLFSNTMKN